MYSVPSLKQNNALIGAFWIYVFWSNNYFGTPCMYVTLSILIDDKLCEARSVNNLCFSLLELTGLLRWGFFVVGLKPVLAITFFLSLCPSRSSQCKHYDAGVWVSIENKCSKVQYLLFLHVQKKCGEANKVIRKLITLHIACTQEYDFGPADKIALKCSKEQKLLSMHF